MASTASISIGKSAISISFSSRTPKTVANFEPSFKRLTEAGMERVFGARRQDQHQNQLLLPYIMVNQRV